MDQLASFGRAIDRGITWDPANFFAFRNFAKFSKTCPNCMFSLYHKIHHLTWRWYNKISKPVVYDNWGSFFIRRAQTFCKDCALTISDIDKRFFFLSTGERTEKILYEPHFSISTSGVRYRWFSWNSVKFEFGAKILKSDFDSLYGCKYLKMAGMVKVSLEHTIGGV